MRFTASYILLALLAFISTSTAQNTDPGILFSTLLNEMHMKYEMGTVKFNYLTAINLPGKSEEEEDTAKFAYVPKGSPSLTSIIKFNGYDEDYATMFWHAQNTIGLLWTMSEYDVKKSSQPKAENGWMEFKTPGTFTMEFYLDDELFYKFPFTISKLPGQEEGDPLDKFFLDGPWDNYCYLFYLGGMPNMNMKLVIWLRNKERRPTKNVKVLGILMKDGAPVAKTSEGPQELILTPEWQRFEFPIGASIRDNAGKLSFKGLKAQNLLNAPGNYELMITVDNQLYGMYPFVVEETGVFRLIEEQDPERTSAKTRIYGGKDTIWLKKKQD